LLRAYLRTLPESQRGKSGTAQAGTVASAIRFTGLIILCGIAAQYALTWKDIKGRRRRDGAPNRAARHLI
jgi:hypothetical protein